MPIEIDKKTAADILRVEAKTSARGAVFETWLAKVEELSRLCEEGNTKTHISFLGTAILAKSINANVDLFAIKPAHAQSNPYAYCARTLCHGVLVPMSAELGFNLGVTGREPLNNQPYFRMTRLDDGTPVSSRGRAAFDYMLLLVRGLQEIRNVAEARKALRAYISVRRGHQRRYIRHDAQLSVSPQRLLELVQEFVRQDSEGGKRAQAVVAGLMDVFAGPDRVKSGRINDPSRRQPGDVCVASREVSTHWEKAIEVRDKPVLASDVQIFAKKCADMGVRETALVMTSDLQERLDNDSLTEWATNYGIGLTLFYSWKEFVPQALYWSEPPKPEGATLAIGYIHERLITVDASEATVRFWQKLAQSKN